MKLDLHTHYYPEVFFQMIRDTPSEFSFDKDPTGRTIITYRGARFFGITPPMTDPAKRLEDMDRVGIDVEVISLSTPNIFFADAQRQPEVARILNDAYAELIASHPTRFKGFASIPMDNPDAALRELHRAIDELKLNGVVLLSNIQGRALTAPEYRPFFEEANRMNLCIFLHPMIPVVLGAVQRICPGSAGRIPFRHNAGGSADVFCRDAERIAQHSLDHRASGRRDSLPDGAARQRLSRLRGMPGEHRRAAKRVSEAAAITTR